MPNCSARRAQRAGSFTSSWIISAVVRPVSSSPGAEQVGVIALPLVADQLLQLLEGEAGYAGEVAFVLAAEQGQVASQSPREGGFAAAVATDKRPALTRSQVQLVYF